MIVVSDTSPLNYLCLIDHTHLLPALFGEVAIPPAVAGKLSDLRAPHAARELIAKSPPWLLFRAPSVSVVDRVPLEAPKLGGGELEVIGLATEMHADLLLADERRATREARSRYHLRVTAILGVLVLASVRELVDLPAVIRLLEATSYRMPKSTVAQVLRDDALRKQKNSP